MKQYLEIKDIDVYAFHGCINEEGKIPGHFSVDLLLEMDLSAAAESDDLNHTADYVWLHDMVREEMAIRSKLIEHVAGRILSRLSEKYPHAISRKVFVKKFNPPVNGQLGVATVMLSS